MNWSENERIKWRPPEKLKISDWTESRISLTGHSEEKGPLRLRRTPYLIPIMDAFLDPDIETIVFCKSAQIAGTTAMLAVAGYYAEMEPCPIMFCMADEDTAVYINRERLRSMFRDSVDLNYLYDERKFGKTENNFTNGSYIAMAWASSVAKLASRPMRIAIADEVDKPGYYLTTQEASPISLLIERTETFNRRKIGILSTPTVETGNITIELESCDVVYDYHVPCPYCGIFQPLRWSLEHSWGFTDGLYLDEDGNHRELGQVIWDGGRAATDKQIDDAGYQCGSCKKKWSTIVKNQAVELGKMVARKPIGKKKIKKVGYHVNRLYSLLGNSGNIPKLVRDWIKAQSSQKKLRGFINSTLAEPWTQIIVKTSESEILSARCDLPGQTVPKDAVALTAGIDPQMRGFWFCVRAWARDYTSWLIHYGFLGTWDEVDALLFETRYPIEGSDRVAPIWRAAIDTGGGKSEFDYEPSMTEAAYWWIRENGIGRGCNIWGTKGAARAMATKISLGKIIDRTPSGKPLPGGIQLVMIDTDQWKDAYHYRLKQASEDGVRAAYLNADVNVDYAKQIMAERKQLNEKGLQVWTRIKPDNHYFDCECLAMAVADPEWIGGGVNLVLNLAEMEVEKQNRKRARDNQQERKKFQRPDMSKIRERLKR